MLTYEVQYKCLLSPWNMPTIHYRYRKSGKFFWERKDRVLIDDFAWLHCEEYYADNDYTAPSFIPMYERMSIMRKIIDERYNGRLVNYINAMVEYEIVDGLIQNNEDSEAIELAMSFVSNEWNTTTIRIGE